MLRLLRPLSRTNSYGLNQQLWERKVGDCEVAGRMGFSWNFNRNFKWDNGISPLAGWFISEKNPSISG